MDEKQTSSPNSFARTVFGLVAGAVLVVSTSLITLYVARAHFHNELCAVNGPIGTPRLSFPTEEAEWDTTHRIHIDEKGVTLMLTDASDRCYVMPINRNNEQRTLVLVHDPLSEEMLDQLAGPHAVAYCGDAPAYLLKEVGALEQSRQKRDAVMASTDSSSSSASAGSAPAAAPPSSGSSAASSGSSAASSGSSAASSGSAAAAPAATTPSAAAQAAAAAAVPPGERASGLNLKYEERNPRCEDLILDCGKDGAIGQTQQCYTWINGVILMKQECTDVNKFKIYMSKPPGRILKIAQREWKVCVERRQQGLRC